MKANEEYRLPDLANNEGLNTQASIYALLFVRKRDALLQGMRVETVSLKKYPIKHLSDDASFLKSYVSDQQAKKSLSYTLLTANVKETNWSAERSPFGSSFFLPLPEKGSGIEALVMMGPKGNDRILLGQQWENFKLPGISWKLSKVALVMSSGLSVNTLLEGTFLTYQVEVLIPLKSKDILLTASAVISFEPSPVIAFSTVFGSEAYEIPTLKDLAELTGADDLLNLLPTPLAGASQMGLKAFDFEFDTGAIKAGRQILRKIEAEVGLNKEWKIWGDKITLKDFVLIIGVEASEGQQGFQTSLYIKAKVNFLNAEAILLFNSRTGELSFNLTNLAFSTLLDELSNGQLKLPGFMQAMTLSKVTLSHNFDENYSYLFCQLTNSLSIAGNKARFDAAFSLAVENGKIFGGIYGSMSCLGLNFQVALELSQSTVFRCRVENIDLAKIVKAIADAELPAGMPNLVIESLSMSLSSDKEIQLEGVARIGKQSNKKLSINDVDIPLAAAKISVRKTASSLKIEISVMGGNFPAFDTLGMVLRQYQFKFLYNKEGQQKADWLVSGALSVEAFERLLSFEAQLAKQSAVRSFVFSAKNEPVLDVNCFERPLEVTPAILMKALRDKGAIDNRNALKAGLNIEKLELPKALSPESIVYVKDTLRKVQNNDKPLVKMPDLLNISVNDQLCTVNPLGLKLTWEKEENKPAAWSFSGTGSFKLYDFFESGKTFFSIDEGTLKLYKKDKETGITFEARKAEAEPLRWIPGFRAGLPALMGELSEQHPKSDAFLRMLKVGLGAVSFIKRDKEWELQGNAYMLLTEDLKTVNKDLYEVCDRFFPTVNGQRKIKGTLGLSSKTGLSVTLLNDSGLEIPNLLKKVIEDLDEELKKSINEGFRNSGIDTTVEDLFNLGKSYVRIEQIGFRAFKKDMELKVMLALGLPSLLNDRLFGKNGKLNGLLKTYDRAKLKPLNGITYPDDNLMRAGLVIGTKGIGGKIEKFNLIDQVKLSQLVGEAIGKSYKETPESIEFDFDVLMTGVTDTPEKDRKYGKVAIDKPRFNLSMQDGSFYAKGGVRILSEQLQIPVRPLVKKVISFLPLSYLKLGAVDKITDNLIEGIPVRSIDFFKDGKLSLSAFEEWLISMLGDEHKKSFAFPASFKKVVEDKGGAMANRLPARFKEYLAIVLPKGFDFELNISADKSFSFHFAVDQSGKEYANLKPYLQLLIPPTPSMPLYMYGVRLRKIGFGTALFNQLLRVDLSGDLDMFNMVHLASSLVLPEKSTVTDEKLQLMLPDKDKFSQTVKLRDLLTVIILQTQIPIPVPLFYNQVYGAYWGLEGIETEMDLQFSAPQFNVVEILKKFFEVINFFRKGNESLHVPTHYLAKLSGEAPYKKGVIPAFQAGPLYYTLPGYFGYELVDEGGKETKQKITIGFKDRKVIDLLELIGTGANALKFSLFHRVSSEIPKKVPVKTAKDPKKVEIMAPPLNYLIQYFDLKDRVNRKKVKLFYLFDIDISWAVSTPQEFREKAYPLIFKDQPLQNVGYAQSEDSMLSIVPSEKNASGKPEGLQDTDQGAVLFLRGAAQVGGVLGIDTALAIVVSEQLGFATAVSFRAFIAKLLKVELWGMMKLNTSGKSNELFSLKGSSKIELMGATVLEGSFGVDIASDYTTRMSFEGMLDIFPKSVYGDSFPIQLYSVEKAGNTDRGKVKGELDNDRFQLSGGAYLSLGVFKMTGAVAVLHNMAESKFETDLSLSGARLIMKASREGNSLKWLGFMTPLSLGGGLIKVEATSSRKVQHGSESLDLGPSASLIIEGKVLKSFYLDGKVDLFGLKLSGQMHLNASGFRLLVDTKLKYNESGGAGYSFDLTIDHVNFSVKGKGQALLDLDLKLDLGSLGVLHLAKFHTNLRLQFESVGAKSQMQVSGSFQLQVGNLPRLEHTILISQAVPLGTGALKDVKTLAEDILSDKAVIDQIKEAFKDPSNWKKYVEEGIITAINGAKMVTEEINKVLKNVFGVTPADLVTSGCAATSFANNPITQVSLMSMNEDEDIQRFDNAAPQVPAKKEVRADPGAQLEIIRYFRTELLKESVENPAKKGKTMGEWYVALYEELSQPMVDFFKYDSGKNGTGDFNYLTYSEENKPNGITIYKELLEILKGAKEGESRTVSKEFWKGVLWYVGEVSNLAEEEYKERFKVVWRGLVALMKSFQGLIKYTDRSYQEIRDKVLPQLVPPNSIEELKRKLNE